MYGLRSSPRTTTHSATASRYVSRLRLEDDPMGDFDGLVAVVTGGAAGIGAAAAALLLDRGAHVAALDRDAGGPDRSLAVPCDVTDRAGVEAAIAAVVERFGGLDIVINNAGISAVGDVAANNDAEWAHVLDVNVTGMARVAAAALPHLRR